MYKYIAIPAKYLDPSGGLRTGLTPEEQADIAANYGQQPLSPADIAQRAADDAALAATLKPRLKAHLAELRFNTVDAGFDLNGIRVLCDTRTTAYLTALRLEAQENPNFTVQWKAPTGFVTLTSPLILAVTQAARQFVQKCFDAEAAVLPDIENDTLTTEQAVAQAFAATLAAL